VLDQSLIFDGQPLIRVPGRSECVPDHLRTAALVVELLGAREQARHILGACLKHEVHHWERVPAVAELVTELAMLAAIHAAYSSNPVANSALVLDRFCVENVYDLIRQISLAPITAVGGAGRRRRGVHLRRARRAAARHFGVILLSP